MDFPTWKEIDEELDMIEEGDVVAVVEVFEAHRNEMLVVDGRKERVTVSSFARHIGMPRHQLDSWVALGEAAQLRHAG